MRESSAEGPPFTAIPAGSAVRAEARELLAGVGVVAPSGIQSLPACRRAKIKDCWRRHLSAGGGGVGAAAGTAAAAQKVHENVRFHTVDRKLIYCVSLKF